MKNIRWKTITAATALLVLPNLSQAGQPVAVNPQSQQVNGSTTINIDQNVVKISGRMSLGLLVGEANEYVYNTPSGIKASHLEWQMDSLAVLGLGGSINVNHWLKFNADLVVNLSEGTGEMDDYDWMVPGYSWTHWSHHEEMEVDGLAMFDINAEFSFYQTPAARLFGIAGYKHDNFEWSASGGNYIYSVNGFRDSTGTFPDDEKAISYEQTYDAPYLGVGFEADMAPFSFSGRMIFSSFAEMEAVDNHYLRNLVFTDDFDEVDLFGFSLNAAYSFTDNIRLMGSYSFQQYDEAKGTTSVKDLTTGAVTNYGSNSAGADNKVSLFMATLIYDF